MRCLTLAKKIEQLGEADVRFICRKTPGNLIQLIEQNGFPVVTLPFADELPDHMGQELDLMGTLLDGVTHLVLDNYCFDRFYEEKLLKLKNVKILVIDDLANRQHSCQYLLDQNAYIDFSNRYDHLVPDGCIKLLGPEFCLLRDEFYRLRQQVKIRMGPVKRVLILFGGSDPSNETVKALRAVNEVYKESVVIDVVIGSSNPHFAEVENLCKNMPRVSFYCQIPNVGELMLAADLSIGAGGSTSWERCCLGLPAIVAVLAENQEAIGRSLDISGASITIESNYIIKVSHYCSALLGIDDIKLSEMSGAAYNLVDALGASRVCDAFIKH